MPTPSPEKTYHRLFEWGVWIKTIIAIGETVIGVLLYALSTATLNALLYHLLGGEVTEMPRDTLIALLLRGFGGITGTAQSFWAFIFLTHGVVKLALLVGLIKNKLWAYPASAIVFSLLAIYQIYTLATGSPDILLELITALDVVVIILILHEYKHRRIQNPKNKIVF